MHYNRLIYLLLVLLATILAALVIGQPDRFEYRVFEGSAFRVSQAAARAACQRQAAGADLANIVGLALLNALSRAVEGPVFIGAWNGESYGNVCLALYPSGSVAVPVGGCDAQLGYICQVPRTASSITAAEL